MSLETLLCIVVIFAFVLTIHTLVTWLVIDNCLKQHHGKLDLALRQEFEYLARLCDDRTRLTLNQPIVDKPPYQPMQRRMASPNLLAKYESMTVGDKEVPLVVQPETPRGLRRPLDIDEAEAIGESLWKTY